MVSGRELMNRICDNGIVEHTAVGVVSFVPGESHMTHIHH